MFVCSIFALYLLNSLQVKENIICSIIAAVIYTKAEPGTIYVYRNQVLTTSQ